MNWCESWIPYQDFFFQSPVTFQENLIQTAHSTYLQKVTYMSPEQNFPLTCNCKDKYLICSIQPTAFRKFISGTPLRLWDHSLRFADSQSLHHLYGNRITTLFSTITWNYIRVPMAVLLIFMYFHFL